MQDVLTLFICSSDISSMINKQFDQIETFVLDGQHQGGYTFNVSDIDFGCMFQ
jgi:hypothetical protein